MPYNFLEVEKKWLNRWEEDNTFYCDVYDKTKPKYYVLDMFPYPSGNGLHVGHPKGYTASDVIARLKRMQGYNVLHPMGFDAFGLPAEQYALKTNNQPKEFTYRNIENFKAQMRNLGLSYDWSKEIATTDVEYYKWTQWIFTKLYEMDLAYVAEIPVNWCEELQSVLANEEVVNGRSEIGGYPVVRKPMRQWVLRITKYAERLLQDLELVDWPSSTKEMQINWIGKSEGASVFFKVADSNLDFEVFTTRADTLFGATYCVLAPEHPFVEKITTASQKEEVDNYVREASLKSDLERSALSKEKTGVFTGAYAINPVNGKKIPIWISDYVLVSYGTGAIMAVPAHDQRDFEFAKKFNLEIIPVVEGFNCEEANPADGIHINSEFLDGLDKEQAIAKMIEFLETKGIGSAKTTYKLRDWLFSRQRYWGEPIPVVYFEDGTERALSLEELPLELPYTENFKPAPGGLSPLANIKEFTHVIIDGKKAKRETNIMPQWAGSCWYYLRYLDPRNNDKIADEELIKQWLPVDLYIGGAEHAVLHLLYARFWHKVLYDLGIVETKEPFAKLFHQGMLLGENGEKMSKSRGNVVNPDDIILSHGADALRLYEMFMGPLEASLAWSTTGLDGAKRFLDRVYRILIDDNKLSMENDHSLDKIYHKSVKKITRDLETLNLNTVVSQMMIFINECQKVEKIYFEYAKGFIQILHTICPFIASEMWEKLGLENIDYSSFPSYEEKYCQDDILNIIVQVNGKLRAKLELDLNLSDDEIKQAALNDEKVQSLISGKEIRKVIVAQRKIVNIVVNG